MLLSIALSASYNDIRDVIRATPTERDDMVRMVGFTDLHPTVVAASFLTFELVKQLLDRIGAANLALLCSTPV